MKNPFKDFDFMDAAITLGGVVVGDSYLAAPIGTGIDKLVTTVAPTLAPKTKSTINGVGKVAVGLALPFIVRLATKEKTITKLAVSTGVGIAANGGKQLAKEAGIIKGAYSGLQTRYINPSLSGSPQNMTSVAGSVKGSPNNFTSVAGGNGYTPV